MVSVATPVMQFKKTNGMILQDTTSQRYQRILIAMMIKRVKGATNTSTPRSMSNKPVMTSEIELRTINACLHVWNLKH